MTTIFHSKSMSKVDKIEALAASIILEKFCIKLKNQKKEPTSLYSLTINVQF